MQIISVREQPEYKEKAIKYFQDKWANENTLMIYEDSITHCIGAINPLPQWYLLVENHQIIGCAGLVTNDFISRVELYPWIVAVYIEKDYRGNNLASKLLSFAEFDAKKMGFSKVYVSTSHIGFYEKYGYKYIGVGYHPWGESSRIYERNTDSINI